MYIAAPKWVVILVFVAIVLIGAIAVFTPWPPLP